MKFVLYAVQFGTAALVFLFSALASWYQGSELLKVPWEWKYTAKFTKLLYGLSQDVMAAVFRQDACAFSRRSFTFPPSIRRQPLF